MTIPSFFAVAIIRDNVLIVKTKINNRFRPKNVVEPYSSLASHCPVVPFVPADDFYEIFRKMDIYHGGACAILEKRTKEVNVWISLC